MFPVMKSILLVIPNPFTMIGSGASSVYSEIILRNPNKNFFFFTKPDSAEIYDLPKNCFPIFLDGPISIDGAVKRCKGMSFDVIDIPDYQLMSLRQFKTLRQLLMLNNIKASKTYLALHGRPSKTELKSRNTNIREILDVYVAERVLSLSVDICYGISAHYAKKTLNLRKKIILDPNHLRKSIDKEQRSKIQVEETKIKKTLTFIGRQEKVKGIDIFLEVIRRVDSDEFDFEIIGPKVPNLDTYNDIESHKIFSTCPIAELQLSEESLAQKLRNENRIIIIPSRFESFSLVALDALNNGNKVVLGSKAGIIQSLRNVNINNLYTYKQSNDLQKNVDAILSIINKIQLEISVHQDKKTLSDQIEFKINRKQKLVSFSELYD